MQQKYRYTVDYKGYRFTLDGFNAPTEQDVEKLYLDSIVNKQIQEPEPMKTFDIGNVESAYDRAKRNSEQVGTIMNENDYQDATFWERFGEAAKLAAVPHFGTMESQFSPADERSEILAEALGSIAGTTPLMIGASLAMGGVGGIALGGTRAASIYKKYHQFNKLIKKSEAAQKAGRINLAKKIRNRASHYANKHDDVFASAHREGMVPNASGFLGKALPGYENTIMKLAAKNPKHARALNLFANNMGTMALVGQTKLPLQLEGRLEQLTFDAASGVVFSVAGLPTMLGYASKGVKYGAEPLSLMGAGMYSDLGQTDMSLEERMIHGSALVGFHYARQGLNSLQIKEKIGYALRLANPKLSESRLNDVMASKGMNNVVEASMKESIKKPTYSEKNNPERVVELLRIETPTKDNAKHRAVYRDIDTGQVSTVLGGSRPDVLKKFQDKFSKNIAPLRTTPQGKDLSPSEKQKLKDIKLHEKELREALESNRGYKVTENVQKPTEQLFVDPLKRRGEQPFDNRQAISVDKTKQVADKGLEGISFKVGDMVRIPKYDTATGQIDYTKAGFGKYIGRMKDFKNADRQNFIMPEWMKREPYKGVNFFGNVPIFEIKTHGGSRKQIIALDGQIPKRVREAIEKANQQERPSLDKNKENPRFKEISENPILFEQYQQGQRTFQWNVNSPLLKLLMTDKPRGGANKQITQLVTVPKSRPPNKKELSKFIKETGFKDNQESTFYKSEKGKFAIEKEVSGRTAEDNFTYHAQEVKAYKRAWEENRGGFFGAKQTFPYNTQMFKDIHASAVKAGYNKSRKQLYEDFTEGKYKNVDKQVTEFVEKEYTFYAPNRLTKLKLSNGKSAFPKGDVTPDRALAYQKDQLELLARRLSDERIKERIRFEQFRNADISQYPDINKLEKTAKIDKEVYESYPELNPSNDAPFTVNFQWDYRTTNKIQPKSAVAMRNGKIATFKTEADAEAFAREYWLNANSLESMLSNTVQTAKNLQGPEYAIWEKQRRKLKQVQKEEKMPDAEYRFLLENIYPESRGSSKNMTFDELKGATSIISNDGNSITYNSKQTSIVPPVTMQSNIQSKYRRFTQKASEYVLPIYTQLMMSLSKAAQLLGRRMVKHELARQSITGDFSQFKIEFKKAFNLTNKDFDNFSTLIDRKYKDFYDKSLDKYDTNSMIRVYTAFRHKVLAEYMINKGVEVRNAKTTNAQHEKLFESYDSKGKFIELENGYDAIRLVEGISFLDSNGALAMPKGFAKVLKNTEKNKLISLNQEGRETLTTKFPIADDYIKTLRTFNPQTGKYDGGWVIVDKTRYAFNWTDKNNYSVTELTNRVERKNPKKESDRYVVVHNKDGAYGKFNHHIEKNYLTRMITNEFKELVGLNEDFRLGVADVIATTDPTFMKMQGSQSFKQQEALKYINNIDKFWRDQSGVFGTQYTRIADLPPVIAIEQGTNRIIKLTSFKDSNGNPVSKGSRVVDKDGVGRDVGRVIDVYERSFDKILSRYGQNIAHISPTFEYFGRGGAKSDQSLKEINKIALESNESFANWAKESLELQLNAVQKDAWYYRAASRLTSVTAQIGLSSPLSGYKNFILGQQSNATVFGFRGAINGLFNALANPKSMSNLTGRIGGKDAGVHELLSGRIVYSKYNPGMMRQTEIINRIVSASIAEPALRMHIDNLNDVKSPMNKGVSKESSMRTLTDVFKFTDKQISDLVNLGSTQMHTRPELIQQAQQMSHLITQGGPSLPFVPKWMGKNWAKPLTLFYRVAYRMSENIANSVIKPIITDGNPVPILRYISMLPVTGAAIFSAHYRALGEDTRNRFKTQSEQLYELALRAEGLGIASNAMDDYGNVVDSFQPATVRAVKSLVTNTLALVSGKKFVGQTLKDLTTENVVFLDRVLTVYENQNLPDRKKYNDSQRRQRQFVNVYFKKTPYLGDELSSLTTKSPYYRAVKEVFWSNASPEEKARVYYAARNYVAQSVVNSNPSLIKIPHKAKKEAKSNLKTILTSQRPIPSSWRKRRATEGKTRYDLYMSKIDDKTKAEEMEIENIYQKRLREMNFAISKFRNQFDKDPFLPPMDTDSSVSSQIRPSAESKIPQLQY